MTFSNNKVPRFDSKNLRISTKDLYRYVSSTTEYLTQVLQNIDEDNLSDAMTSKLGAVSTDELSTSITAGGTTWTFDEEHIYRTVNGEKEQVI